MLRKTAVVTRYCIVLYRGKKRVPKVVPKVAVKRKGSQIKNMQFPISKLVKTIETKSGVVGIVDGLEISHNSFITLTDGLLQTSSGILDLENAIGQRIGDKIILSGICVKCMLELKERCSDVTFRMLVIRKRRCSDSRYPLAGSQRQQADILWQGASGNKMIDTIN